MGTIRRFSKNIFLNTTANFFSIILSLVISVLLNRHYGKEDYGVLVIVFTVTGLFPCLCDLGSKSALNRFIPKYFKSNSYNLMSRTLNAGISLQLSGLFVGGIALFFSAEYIATVFFKRTELILLFKIGILYFVGLSASQFVFNLFQSLQDWGKELLLQVVYHVLYLGFVLISIFVFKKNIEYVLYSNFLAAIIIVFTGYFLIPRGITGSLLKKMRFSVFKNDVKKIGHFGFPLIYGNLAFYVLMWSDKLILGRYMDSATLTLYYIGFNLYNTLVVLFKSLYNVFMPYVAGFSVSNQQFISEKFRKIFRIFLYGGMLSAIIAFFWVEPIVTFLYGRDYLLSIIIFQLCLIIFIFRIIPIVCGMFNVNVFNLTKQAAIVGGIYAAITLILNLVFIPLFGCYGAVLANILAQLLNLAVYFCIFRQIRKMFPLDVFLKSIFLLFLLIGIYFLASSFLVIKNQFILGIVMAVGYVFLMKIFKEFTLEDIQMLKKMLTMFKKTQGIESTNESNVNFTV